MHTGSKPHILASACRLECSGAFMLRGKSAVERYCVDPTLTPYTYPKLFGMEFIEGFWQAINRSSPIKTDFSVIISTVCVCVPMRLFIWIHQLRISVSDTAVHTSDALITVWPGTLHLHVVNEAVSGALRMNECANTHQLQVIWIPRVNVGMKLHRLPNQKKTIHFHNNISWACTVHVY